MNGPTWKWDDINMDFVVGLPWTRGKNYSIWVVVDRLRTSAHFIPVNSTYSVQEYARIYINEIVSLHGISLSIIFDRGAQFTTQFWSSFQKELRTQVKLSTAFHPQIDCQIERTIQTLRIYLGLVLLISRGVGINACLW